MEGSALGRGQFSAEQAATTPSDTIVPSIGGNVPNVGGETGYPWSSSPLNNSGLLGQSSPFNTTDLLPVHEGLPQLSNSQRVPELPETANSRAPRGLLDSTLERMGAAISHIVRSGPENYREIDAFCENIEEFSIGPIIRDTEVDTGAAGDNDSSTNIVEERPSESDQDLESVDQIMVDSENDSDKADPIARAAEAITAEDGQSLGDLDRTFTDLDIHNAMLQGGHLEQREELEVVHPPAPSLDPNFKVLKNVALHMDLRRPISAEQRYRAARWIAEFDMNTMQRMEHLDQALLAAQFTQILITGGCLAILNVQLHNAYVRWMNLFPVDWTLFPFYHYCYEPVKQSIRCYRLGQRNREKLLNAWERFTGTGVVNWPVLHPMAWNLKLAPTFSLNNRKMLFVKHRRVEKALLEQGNPYFRADMVAPEFPQVNWTMHNLNLPQLARQLGSFNSFASNSLLPDPQSMTIDEMAESMGLDTESGKRSAPKRKRTFVKIRMASGTETETAEKGCAIIIDEAPMEQETERATSTQTASGDAVSTEATLDPQEATNGPSTQPQQNSSIPPKRKFVEELSSDSDSETEADTDSEDLLAEESYLDYVKRDLQERAAKRPKPDPSGRELIAFASKAGPNAPRTNPVQPDLKWHIRDNFPYLDQTYLDELLRPVEQPAPVLRHAECRCDACRDTFML